MRAVSHSESLPLKPFGLDRLPCFGGHIMFGRCRFIAVFSIAVFSSSIQVHASNKAPISPSFLPLGALKPGGTSAAFALSADGTTIVGASESANSAYEAFRWTRSEGMIGLGDFDGGAFESHAYGVSADGSTIVGTGTRSDRTEAFRWTVATGMMGIGWLPSDRPQSAAYGVSSDGSVIVGRSIREVGDEQTCEAFRWAAADGMVALGDLPGGVLWSEAYAVSGDGSIVAGRGTSIGGTWEAFRWENGAMGGLGDLPGGGSFSVANDISNDGSVVVGLSTSSLGNEAFGWASGFGFVPLGDLPGGAFWSSAHGVSADGSVIVGHGFIAANPNASIARAFIWDQSHGMRDLQAFLEGPLGLNLGGWSLTFALAVSDDGNTIVGTGENPAGITQAWLAVIPEPPTVWIAAAATVAIAWNGFRSRSDRLRVHHETQQDCPA